MLGKLRGFCEGDRRVECLVLRVESRSDFERFVRVRSGERLLRLANIDRVFGLSMSDRELLALSS
jgi:hypothetical protein